MPCKKKYYKSQNLILTVFYGKVSCFDLLSHLKDLEEDELILPNFQEIIECGRITNLDEFHFDSLHNISACQSQFSKIRTSDCIIVADKPIVFGCFRQYATLSEKYRNSMKIFDNIHEGVQNLKAKKIFKISLKIKLISHKKNQSKRREAKGEDGNL